MNTYYAAIFTSQRTEHNSERYESMSDNLVELVKTQPGFIRIGSVRDNEEYSITISYWESLEAIQKWKANTTHQVTQQKGKETWYSQYNVQICKVVRDYSFKGID
ncbi:antibiotic biosynthesis monooxygenase family protein [Bacillus nitratireducens]|uniref:antibiotic biosynthesis monooxygenase family protein n=1 Tax=Bacillus nitratireducens TaxID=2026193 RepID=UPI001BA48ED2|nr:antibiotic biosynthesis monooxygenase [Bacillus nitratireducens]MED0993673.1 antibiotic biosynthesis monooxygenase [Bacillus nitratireducens]QUG87010.1 antibiotic biosynthesis monooxygenase [Bacillus nitratireducens]